MGATKIDPASGTTGGDRRGRVPEAFRVKNLSIYPKGLTTGTGAWLTVAGKSDREGWHSSESTSLSDEEVDALHQWLGEVIAERDNGS